MQPDTSPESTIDSTGYDMTEAIRTIRSLSGGMTALSDEQIAFIIKQRNYYIYVRELGPPEQGVNAYEFSGGEFRSSDVNALAKIITEKGVVVDEPTLRKIYEAEWPYVKQIGMAEGPTAIDDSVAAPILTPSVGANTENVNNSFRFGNPELNPAEVIEVNEKKRKDKKIAWRYIVLVIVTAAGLEVLFDMGAWKEAKEVRKTIAIICPGASEIKVGYTRTGKLNETKYVSGAKWKMPDGKILIWDKYMPKVSKERPNFGNTSCSSYYFVKK